MLVCTLILNNKLEEKMKIPKVLAIFGILVVTAMTSGCLQGPVADGEFAVFPNGVFFDGGQGGN